MTFFLRGSPKCGQTPPQDNSAPRSFESVPDKNVSVCQTEPTELQIDTAILEFQTATTPARRRAAMAKIDALKAQRRLTT